MDSTHQSTGQARKVLFARRLRVTLEPGCRAMPLAWLDSFAMRSFTGSALFDDTLPLADGLLEAGLRVPLDQLAAELERWCRAKGRLHGKEEVRIAVDDVP